MLRSALAGCLWLFAQADILPAADRVVISEFLAINNTGGRDDDGDRSDWIELHNPGSGLVQLEGWALTDRRRQLLRWRFPAVELSAGGYLVVYASGKDRAVTGQPLHANFKLKGEGDYLALVRPEGTVADEFAPTYPKQKSDVSYGLTAAGTRNFLLSPTPGGPNEETRQGQVAKVEFSHTRGLYEQPFRLALSSATVGAEIRYTLDGTTPTLENGRAYRGPLELARTTILRAAAFKAGHSPAEPATHTFLFPADVIRQSADGLPPAGWPYSWGPKPVNYGMDPKVVDDPRFRDELIPGLRAIPSVSLVLNLDDLFNEQTGIYVNSGRSGRENERPVSVEYLVGDDAPGFQIDAGIRIRGGFSRMPMNPKHAFRLFFRRDYGGGKLRFPLFGPDGAQEFDNLDLRTFQNYSWSFQADPRGVFLRDQFNRDLQLAMGRPGARGDYCHLYINGIYWGLYNTCERPEASYGATYFGGKEGDYDVVKVDSGFGEQGMQTYATITTDGNLDAWRELYELARQGVADPARYQRLLGNNPDGTRNPAYPVLLDPGNLIDYMLVILYGGNMDAPITKFGGDARPNNWHGIRSRTGDHGFRFFVWDAEHTFLEVNEDRTGPFPAGNEFETSNPQWLWQQCLENADFRMLVADHIHRYFFNGGLLTAANVADRFQRRAAEIESAVIGESARWGDTEAGFPMGTPPRLNAQGELLAGPLNRDDDWRVEIGRILKEYIPRRSDVVLAQLYSHGLVPEVAVPQASSNGSTVILASPAGEIFYTLDGSDPRQPGGSLSAAARRAEGAITRAAGQALHARARVGEEWSALVELAN